MNLHERKKQRLRAEIIRCAGERFRRLGYAQTRLEDVFEDAIVSSPTFHRHFAGKAALFVEWARQEGLPGREIVLTLLGADVGGEVLQMLEVA